MLEESELTAIATIKPIVCFIKIYRFINRPSNLFPTRKATHNLSKYFNSSHFPSCVYLPFFLVIHDMFINMNNLSPFGEKQIVHKSHLIFTR